MKIRLEPLLPKKKSLLDTPAYKNAINNAGSETSMAIQVDFEVTTRTWQHKPSFPIQHTPGKYEWEISTDDKVYGYVSMGTPAHIIRPKVAKRLVFYRTGFRAKSRVGWIGSNKGAKATKDLTFTKVVHHPGITARNFAKTIKQKWDNEWPRQLQRAVRAAAKYGGR